MVWLVGEALLCTGTICRKKNKPCLRGYSFLQAFALCWLKTIRRLSRVGYGHFHLFTIRWFPLVPLPLPPSTFPRITLWMSRPLLGNDSMRHGATQILCLHTHTHMLKSVANVTEFTPRFAPTRTSHTSRSPFHHDAATDKAKAPKRRAATESDSSSSSLCSYIIGNNYGDDGGGIKPSISSFFSFSFFSIIFTPNLIGERHQANVFQRFYKRVACINTIEPIFE